MKERSLKRRKDKGFTLVELIVVLVILAILAAILIPALLGYIDSAKDKQKLVNAKNCLTAAQAELTQLYAINGDKLQPGEQIIEGDIHKDAVKNGDISSQDSDFAKKVLETADMSGNKAPYCFYIAVGSNYTGGTSGAVNNTTKHDMYTVYFALYIEKKGDAPLYYYEGKWTKKNPRLTKDDKKNDIDGTNKFLNGPHKGMRIQYYMISNKTNWGGKNGTFGSTFWSELKKYQQEQFK